MEFSKMKQKSIYQDRKLNTTILLLLLSSLMIGLSLYLTQHYFDLRFPTGLEGKSLCNISGYFNCDKTTLSVASNLFGVPISIFGALIGIFTLIGLVFNNEDYERTIYFILGVNFIGCVLLFAFSLLVIGSLCPFCTLYYIVSGLILFLFYQKSSANLPALGYLAIFAVITLLIAGLTKINIESKLKVQNEVGSDVIKQYYSLPNLGIPKINSDFKIATSANAPIKMFIFSDFECPACKALSEVIPLIATRYEGKIDIQYFFYPLDNSCNPTMDHPLHRFACKAAFAAACMPKNDFAKAHDELFHNQDNFEAGFLDKYIKENKLEKCVADPKTKEIIVSLIKAADPFNIRSTPSYLINGVKIEGALPSDQLMAIMDEILKRAGK